MRERIATEFASIPSEIIDFFTEIANEELDNITMYPLNVHGDVEYKQHYSETIDDVQIIFDTVESGHRDVAGNAVGGHTKCIHYKASVQRVYVYDSAMLMAVTQGEEEIINILYPFNKGIKFQRPKTIQDHHATCAIYSMMYATILLLNGDPTKLEIKSNKIHGDETLYMRIHLLNILANRKLVLLNMVKSEDDN